MSNAECSVPSIFCYKVLHKKIALKLQLHELRSCNEHDTETLKLSNFYMFCHKIHKRIAFYHPV
jgi:hypothetical protein